MSQLSKGTLKKQVENLWTQKNCQEGPIGPKTSKQVSLNGDGRHDEIVERLRDRLKVFWVSHMSGYLKEPNRDNE